jgi:murein DD-endopeptidase MepM/ murein hydrolase activator NlpD
MQLSNATKKRSRKPLYFLIGLLLLALVAVLGYQLFRDRAGPAIAIGPDQEWISDETAFSVSVRDQGLGLKELQVELVQNNQTVPALDKTFDPPEHEFTATVTPDEKQLEDGHFQVRVTARDASWSGFGAGNTARAERGYQLDTRAPRITLLSTTHNLNQGGSGAVVFTVDEPANSAGVQVGDRFFPAYPRDGGEMVCLFAQPLDVPPAEYDPLVTATDRAGNERSAALPHHANPRRFRKDVIRISDSFLNRKMRQFSDRYPGLSNEEVFLAVNRDMRKANRAKLKKIGEKTASRPLWNGRFLRMKGKPMAGFGDQRDYKHNGQVIDHQTHMGVDIASFKRAKVKAANSGRVVFNGFYGIYGNSVIIDHGQGLMTLYAHLSSINVKDGQTVDKGDIIGRTGATGMAGGDHLHYGVLVSGTPVNPKEWWDATWIGNNIDPKLRPGS